MASLDGASLLHKAAFLGLQEAVKAILAEGANPNELDRQGETPLHKAAREGHFEVAKLLVEHGANVNVVSEFGLTPLHWVALNGRLGIANLLMNAGADPYLSDEYLDQLSPVDLAKIMDYDDLVAILERRPASHV
jgi:ankyrin repeat protein